MYEYLGWIYSEAIHYGRLKITGASLSKSKIVQGIKEGCFAGFDDPRLGTFAALRKRGITPEAIKKMIIDVGIKSNDVTLSWENLFSYNRKILDTTSQNRLNLKFCRYQKLSSPSFLCTRTSPSEETGSTL
jgi:glutamyl-tRNA synthetase